LLGNRRANRRSRATRRSSRIRNRGLMLCAWAKGCHGHFEPSTVLATWPYYVIGALACAVAGAVLLRKTHTSSGTRKISGQRAPFEGALLGAGFDLNTSREVKQLRDRARYCAMRLRPTPPERAPVTYRQPVAKLITTRGRDLAVGAAHRDPLSVVPCPARDAARHGLRFSSHARPSRLVKELGLRHRRSPTPLRCPGLRPASDRPALSVCPRRHALDGDLTADPQSPCKCAGCPARPRRSRRRGPSVGPQGDRA
jgi:hypothetical protein